MYYRNPKSRGGLTSSAGGPRAIPIVVGAILASAVLNRWLAREAERRNGPRGQFLAVNGVRLHYVERGTGTPLVLLHGNGSMIDDFLCSGLIDLATEKYRVIAFDRPGFGYSKRQTPVYAGHVTFYVSSPSLNSADANQTNQFAQDRATSDYFSMPGSAIATGCVDLVLPLADIAPALVALVKRPATS